MQDVSLGTTCFALIRVFNRTSIFDQHVSGSPVVTINDYEAKTQVSHLTEDHSSLTLPLSSSSLSQKFSQYNH
jgi:hypothetical protein